MFGNLKMGQFENLKMGGIGQFSINEAGLTPEGVKCK